MCAQHLIDDKHSTAPMEDIMEILHIINKGSMFHACNLTRLDNQINDKSAVQYDAIFDTVIHRHLHREHSPP